VDMRSKTRERLIITTIAVVLAVLLIAGGIYSVRFVQYMRVVNSIELVMLDMSMMPDGTFAGHVDAVLLAFGVEVTVEGGQITAIDVIRHRAAICETSEREKAEMREVADVVIYNQTLHVMPPFGANYRTLVFLYTIQTALMDLNVVEK